MTCVALLATVETKPKETSFLKDALRAEGLDVRIIDLSLYSGSSLLDGEASWRKWMMQANAPSLSWQL